MEHQEYEVSADDRVQPQVVYVTAIRHPDTVRGYLGYWHICAQSMQALLRQPEAKVVAVCNKEHFTEVLLQNPGLPMPAGVEWVAVDAPPPATAKHPHMEDKGLKYYAGLRRALHVFDPAWVFTYDSDDFVSNRLPAWLAANPHPVGYLLAQGYILSNGRMGKRKKFWQLCGTSTVWAAAHLRKYVGAYTPPVGWLWEGLGYHNRMRKTMPRATGHSFGFINWPAAVYRHGTGHNISTGRDRGVRGKKFAAMLRGMARRNTAQPGKAEEFGIPDELLTSNQ
jgi:hypothetical protein